VKEGVVNGGKAKVQCREMQWRKAVKEVWWW
jgi:hypothetical protein